MWVVHQAVGFLTFPGIENHWTNDIGVHETKECIVENEIGEPRNESSEMEIENETAFTHMASTGAISAETLFEF